MKQFFFSILLTIIILIGVSSNTYAFLGDDLGINLYESIDNGYEDLERKMYTQELYGTQEDISKTINEYIAGKLDTVDSQYSAWHCIDKKVSPEDFNKIANGNLSLLATKIGENCKGDDGSFAINTLNTLQMQIDDLQSSSIINSQKKSKQIYQVSRIGLYSDGNNENSSFDLISDLSAIDDIIFQNDVPYVGEEYDNVDDYLQSTFFGDDDESPGVLSETSKIKIHTPETQDQQVSGINPETINPEVYQSINYQSYVCGNDQNLENVLSNEQLEAITGELAGNTTVIPQNEMGENNTGRNTGGTIVSENDLMEDDGGGYAGVNDNALFPCNTFFCITIEFIMYNHQLLGGGSDISIEYLINRSNKHLKSFAAGSMLPSTAATGNFELMFKNLNLSDILHFAVQIQKKPIPMLELTQEDDKKKKNEFAYENMLEDYYKAFHLEYERANDLTKFDHSEEEMVSVINGAGLSNIQAVKNVTEYIDQLSADSEKFGFTAQAIDKHISYNEMDKFYNLFIELERFSSAIYDYSVTTNGIVKKMREIPIDPS